MDEQERKQAEDAGIPCSHTLPEQVYPLDMLQGDGHSEESCRSNEVCGAKPGSLAHRIGMLSGRAIVKGGSLTLWHRLASLWRQTGLPDGELPPWCQDLACHRAAAEYSQGRG